MKRVPVTWKLPPPPRVGKSSNRRVQLPPPPTLTTIDDLPADVLRRILPYLGEGGATAFCLTSRRHVSLCRDERFWSHQAEEDFGLPPSVFATLKGSPITRYFAAELYHAHPKIGLEVAASSGNSALFMFLVTPLDLSETEDGDYVDSAFKYGMIPVMEYILHRHPRWVDELNDADARYNAARRNQREFIDYLMQHADEDQSFSLDYMYPGLSGAVAGGHVDMFRYLYSLIDWQADQEISEEKGLEAEVVESIVSGRPENIGPLLDLVSPSQHALNDVIESLYSNEDIRPDHPGIVELRRRGAKPSQEAIDIRNQFSLRDEEDVSDQDAREDEY